MPESIFPLLVFESYASGTDIIFIAITKQPEQGRLVENQPTAGLSSLNENENEYENGMIKSETELL